MHVYFPSYYSLYFGLRKINIWQNLYCTGLVCLLDAILVKMLVWCNGDSGLHLILVNW